METIFQTVLDALFPPSLAERELFLLSPEKAYEILPRAPTVALQSTLVHIPTTSNARAVFAYKDERVTQLIWNIKYKKSRLAIAIGGYALWKEIGKTPSIVVPIPITPRRRRERGFNQCEELLHEITHHDTCRTIIAAPHLLTRTIHRSRQTLKNRVDRLVNSENIFSINKEAGEELMTKIPRAHPSKIVVIDDVITTGSTMASALTTLHHAGFKNVHGLSLAH